MTTKVAINGLGRIGRAILKLVIDEPAFETAATSSPELKADGMPPSAIG